MSILYPIHKKQKRNFVTSAKQYSQCFMRGVKLPSRAVFSPFALLTKYVLSQGKYETKFLFNEIYIDETNDFCFVPIPGMGAPALALSLELAITLGVKKCIFLGTAGSLQEEVWATDRVICQEALCGDGTSGHYTNHEIVRADRKLLKSFSLTLQEEKQDFHIGRVWSTDAIFRETKAEIQHYQKNAVLGVDMETAAFLAICHQHKIQGVAGLVISDNLSKCCWEPSYCSKEIARKLKTLFDAAHKTLLQES